MSTESTTKAATGRKEHKVLNLYGGQIDAYQRARTFALVACGRDTTEGEVVEEIATGYLEYLRERDTPCEESLICEMVESTALDHNDPSFSRERLKELEPAVLEGMAAEANGPIKGTGFDRMQLEAYFSCPATEHSGGKGES